MSTNLQSNPLKLWNEHLSPDRYGSEAQYYEHILEQYKIYLEFADRISARRTLANTFFLTLNTLVLGVAAFSYEKGPKVPDPWINLFPLVLGLGLCVVWHMIIRAYRHLNTAKYRIIGEYEKRLPSSPFWEAEWIGLLKQGQEPKVYMQLTQIESYVPIAFAAMYILSFIGLILFD